METENNVNEPLETDLISDGHSEMTPEPKKGKLTAVFIVMLIVAAVFFVILWYVFSRKILSEQGGVNSRQIATVKETTLSKTDTHLSVSTPTPTSSRPVLNSYSEDTGVNNQKRYVSPKLGISFLYLTKYTGLESSVVVTELLDKIYLHMDLENYNSGKSVQVFSKNPGESLKATLERQFLLINDPDKCRVTISASPNLPQSYQIGVIEPVTQGNRENLDLTEWIDQSLTCSEYAVSNGIRYFLMDENHPDKLLFFNIGQDALMGTEKLAWQDTVEFLDN